MKNLQTLSNFVLSENDGQRIKELGDLQLHGDLCISGLENVEDVEDASKANLKKKDGLEKLALRWECGETDDTTKEKELLNEFQPHYNLKKLNINGYRGTNFPNWVTHQSFRGMVEMEVVSCINCYFLPPFGQLSSLKRLLIVGMPGVISIGDEFIGTSSSNFHPFPFLEKLTISEMHAWEKCSFTESKQGIEVVFPCLKTLRIIDCEKLNVGLAWAGNCFSSLEAVDIRYCNSMVSVFPAICEIDTKYPCLELIQVEDCPNLESFSEVGLPNSLKQVTIWSCERLISNRLSWNLQRISSLQRLVLIGYNKSDSSDSFPEEGLFPSTLNDIEISYFRELKCLNGNALQRLTSLKRLQIYCCKKLQCLPEEGLPISLHCLEIVNCPLPRERCHRGTGLDWPKIQHIPTLRIELNKI